MQCCKYMKRTQKRRKAGRRQHRWPPASQGDGERPGNRCCFENKDPSTSRSLVLTRIEHPAPDLSRLAAARVGRGLEQRAALGAVLGDAFPVKMEVS